MQNNRSETSHPQNWRDWSTTHWVLNCFGRIILCQRECGFEEVSVLLSQCLCVCVCVVHGLCQQALDNGGMSPLLLAVARGRSRIVRTLLSAQRTKPNCNTDPMGKHT